MYLFGFILTGFIFLPIFTESSTGCRPNYSFTNKVCKGNSTTLTPNDNCSKQHITGFKKRKTYPSRTEWKKIEIDGKKYRYERKNNSLLVVVNNVEENDTGTYGYTMKKGAPNNVKRCCVSLEIDNTCEYLQVQSGSSVNLTCKVENGAEPGTEWRYYKNESSASFKVIKPKNGNIDTTLFPGMKSSFRTLTISQLKKSHSGTYLCYVVTANFRKRSYKFFLKVFIAPTAKAVTSQETHSLRSSLPTTSVTNWMTRNITYGTHSVDTTKQTSTKESVPNSTKEKLKKTQDTVLKTEESVLPTTGDIAKPKSGKPMEGRQISVGTRTNCAFSVSVLSQLYIWYIRLFQ